MKSVATQGIERCVYELIETGPRKFKKKWLGPRGKHLSGVDKQLARLAWDRKRFAGSANA